MLQQYIAELILAIPISVENRDLEKKISTTNSQSKLALEIGSRYNRKTGYFIRDNLGTDRKSIKHLDDH